MLYVHKSRITKEILCLMCANRAFFFEKSATLRIFLGEKCDTAHFSWRKVRQCAFFLKCGNAHFSWSAVMRIFLGEKCDNAPFSWRKVRQCAFFLEKSATCAVFITASMSIFTSKKTCVKRIFSLIGVFCQNTKNVHSRGFQMLQYAISTICQLFFQHSVLWTVSVVERFAAFPYTFNSTNDFNTREPE